MEQAEECAIEAPVYRLQTVNVFLCKRVINWICFFVDKFMRIDINTDINKKSRADYHYASKYIMQEMFMNSIITKKTFVVCAILLLALSSRVLATPMPDFTLPSVVDGKDISSDDFKGKVLLVTFFATWCPPCRKEFVDIQEIVNEYKNDSYEILCISVDRKKGAVESFLEKNGYTMTVLFDDQNIARSFGVTGIPALFLIDEEGNIVWKQAGTQSKERLIELLGLL